jgi:hypothetical protein
MLKRWCLPVIVAVSLALVPVAMGQYPCTSSGLQLALYQQFPTRWNGTTWIWSWNWGVYFSCSAGDVTQCQVCSYAELYQWVPAQGIWWPLTIVDSPPAIGSCGNMTNVTRYTTTFPATGALLPNTTYQVIYYMAPYDPFYGICFPQGQKFTAGRVIEFSNPANPD